MLEIESTASKIKPTSKPENPLWNISAAEWTKENTEHMDLKTGWRNWKI